MADYFGSKQTRVVSVGDRSLDNVVFLTCRPPLSSEWNLINQIGNEKALDAARMSLPSGWLRVGCVSDTLSESEAQSGDALTSESYNENTFKLVSKGGNVAVVNGWRVLVQGWNSPDNNNVIELDEAGGQMYDFVFLEVWRKLVAYNESLYPNGNVSKTPYTDNEILWPTVGTETSMRVQVQYRVRSVPVSTVLSGSSDVFSDVPVHPIAGRVTGEYDFYLYTCASADDIGLYRAGDGSPTSQSELATVDGYAYAIPMFLVYRRAPSMSVFSPLSINSGFTTGAEYASGYVKDRPDGVIVDMVYPQDIVDFRHQILTNTSDVRDSLDRTLSKLVSGDLTTALKRGFDEDGEESTAVSGGSVLTKAERINSTGADNIPNMGTGDEFRRAFCNAGLATDHNVVEVTPKNGGGSWIAGTIAVSSFFSKSYGSIVSVDGLFSTDMGALVTGVTATTSSITIAPSSNLVGTSFNLYMEFTFSYDPSGDGFKDVPRTMLEASKGSFAPISLGDPVKVRVNNAGALLNFGLTPNCGYTTEDDYVVCRGGNYTESFNFGHDLVAYRTTTNPGGTVTFSLTDGKMNGYYILGVKRVRVKSGLVYGNPVSFTVSRTVPIVPPYVITDYIVTVTGYPGADVEVTLVTGNKPPDDETSPYDPLVSMKFFDVNRQGRGVTDTFEMIDFVAVEDTPTNPGSYIIDTTSIGKPIIALATKTSQSGSYEISDAVLAFRHDTGLFVPNFASANVNDTLPVLRDGEYDIDWLPTRIVVSGPVGVGKIRVPVLVHAAPPSSESPYTFYYRMAPYQGILSSSTEFKGKILAEGGSLVTTLGSGAIVNHGYSEEMVAVANGGHIVSGTTGVNWAGQVQAGDYIAVGVTGIVSDPEGFRIESVTGPSCVVISEPYPGAGHTGAQYAIFRKDTPSSGVSNVVDRLPSYMVTDDTGTYGTDSACKSDALDMAGGGAPMANMLPVIRGQDPLASKANDFILGSQTKTNIRGRYDFQLTLLTSPAYRLNPAAPRAHILYQGLVTGQDAGARRKVYQAYLFARSADGMVAGSTDVTGRIYMAVVSGETCADRQNLLNTFSAVDTVDLFELVGRPVVKAP